MLCSLLTVLALLLLQESGGATPARSAPDRPSNFLLALLGTVLAALPIKELLTALVSARRARKERRARTPAAAELRLRKYTAAPEPGGPHGKYSLLLRGLYFVVSTVALWVFGLFLMSLAPGDDTLVFVVVSFIYVFAYSILALVMVFYFFYGFYALHVMKAARREQASRQTEFVVEGDYAQVISRCKESVRAAGMRLVEVDLEEGRIEGAKQHRWLRILDSHGLTNRLHVAVRRTEEGRYTITAVCKGNRVGLEYDKQANQAYLNRFVEPFLS
jgi:hypothetical protein